MRVLIGALVAFSLTTMTAVAANNDGKSAYVGQEDREIKALAPDRIAGLKAGAGLGYAKAAELNGYPGPAHLIELAHQIPLGPGQLTQVVEIRDRMRSDSIALGEKLLDAESALEKAFRAGGLSEEWLGTLTSNIGTVEGKLRARHLAAHLEVTALLSSDQIMRYSNLRGYGTSNKHGGGHKGQHVH